MSLGTSVYVGALSYEIAEGIRHPDPLTAGVAFGALGFTVGVYKWLNKKVKGLINKGKSINGFSSDELEGSE